MNWSDKVNAMMFTGEGHRPNIFAMPIEKQREGEAPAELAPPWFCRSLTLPSHELVGQSRCNDVYMGGTNLTLTIPNPLTSNNVKQLILVGDVTLRKALVTGLCEPMPA